MLFMTVATFQPGKFEEALKGRKEKGTGAPEGMKIINQWMAPDQMTAFTLFEANDARDIIHFSLNWSEFVEERRTYPVAEVEEVLKSIPKA